MHGTAWSIPLQATKVQLVLIGGGVSAQSAFMNDYAALVAAIKAATQNLPSPEWCLFWVQWDPVCMPRNEWAAWIQAIGAFVALYIAVRAPHWFAKRERNRIRDGHFAVICLDLQLGRKLAQTYLEGSVQSPSDRLPLHGLPGALSSVIADQTVHYFYKAALSDWYVNAASFNDCLNLAGGPKRDGGNPMGEDNTKKAAHLIPGPSPGTVTSYDKAMEAVSECWQLKPLEVPLSLRLRNIVRRLIGLEELLNQDICARRWQLSLEFRGLDWFVERAQSISSTDAPKYHNDRR